MAEGVRLRIPGQEQLVLGDGSFLLLSLLAIDDRSGVTVTIGGDVVRVTRDWQITRPAGVTADASVTMRGRRSQFSRIPRDNDVLEIRAGGPTGVLLFGGYIDAPKIQVTGGGALLTLTMRAVGWRHRLNDRELTQAEGVDVVGRATALAQLQALVALIAGEGFTLAATLPTDGGVPFRGDMRFQSIGVLMDEIAKLNNTVVSVLPDRSIPAVDRSLLTSTHSLGWDLLEEIRFESTRQDYRTRQRVRAGKLVRLESHAGRSDGRYRLGGLNNLHPAQSIFDAPLGNGKLWDESVDASGRGHPANAALITPSDSPGVLPTTVVTGADRTIDVLRMTDRGGLLLDGVTLDNATNYALLAKASDGTEYVWSFADIVELTHSIPSAPTISVSATTVGQNTLVRVDFTTVPNATGYRLYHDFSGEFVPGNITALSFQFISFLTSESKTIRIGGTALRGDIESDLSAVVTWP